jgi:GH25 family lysozyme M1 (1,4-beta-N-acetylmuramidase)
MWQYSFTGRVAGIPNEVDLNHCYKNYPYIISPETFDGNERVTTTTSATTTTAITTRTPLAHGIDVSFWQEGIDWKSVKESGIDFAIIRAGYGRLISQKDTRFDENVLGAKEAGIDVGVYWYSYADSVEAAILEAEVCYEVIKDYQFEYPIYFDIEDPLIANLPASTLSEITDAFCSTLEAKGYYVGITSYTAFLTYKLLPYLYEKYDVWVAHYNVTAPTYIGNYGIWQYSSTGYVDGIKTRVDLNYCYKDYPSIMKEYNLNGFGRKIEPAESEDEEGNEGSENHEDGNTPENSAYNGEDNSASSDDTSSEPVTEAETEPASDDEAETAA